MPSLVDTLQGDTASESAIANDGDDMKVLLGQVACHGHSQSSRNRGRSMGHVKSVIDAFFAAGKPQDAFILPQRMELVAPSRQDLVPISLVSNVPDQLVFRSIKDIVQRDRKLNGTETGSQMPARLRDGVDHEAAQLICKLS